MENELYKLAKADFDELYSRGEITAVCYMNYVGESPYA